MSMCINICIWTLKLKTVFFIRMIVQMRNDFDNIKYRLEIWAERECKPIPGLSYSSTTIEARMMETGCASSGVAMRTIPAYSPSRSNLEMDKAISGLGKFYKLMIHNKYINQYPEAVCMELAGLKKTIYYERWQDIYHYIAGHLHYDLK